MIDQKLPESAKITKSVVTRKILQLEKQNGVHNNLELILQNNPSFFAIYDSFHMATLRKNWVFSVTAGPVVVGVMGLCFELLPVLIQYSKLYLEFFSIPTMRVAR